MELHLKPISKGGIPAAISKIEVYRYLNEPGEAESICRDILTIEPDNQEALRLLGLSITDQFTGDASDRYAEARDTFQRLSDPYQRIYHLGILDERKAKAQLKSGVPPHTVLPTFEGAMNYFQQASNIRPPLAMVKMATPLAYTGWQSVWSRREVSDWVTLEL